MTPDEILKGACFPDAETRAAVVARVEAAYRAGYEAAREWQDIATAPKDGSDILIVYRPFNKVEYAQCIALVASHYNGLVDDAGNTYDYATAWQPLPAPPKEST